MPAETRYENFDLRVWREGDRYLAEVTDSPAGPSEREFLNWPFGNSADRVLLLELENAVLKSRLALRGGPIISAEEKVLRDFGAEVFRAVFRDSGSVAHKYYGSRAWVGCCPCWRTGGRCFPAFTSTTPIAGRFQRRCSW